MKKILAAITIAAAVNALAIDGLYSFGIGHSNTATNSNYATTFGSFTGCDGQFLTRTSLFGALAGMDAIDVQRSVGVGAGALAMASNCVDCVAIGDSAGKNWRNRTGWVQIGDAIAVTNGIADIKAPNGARIGPLKIESSENNYDHSIQGNWSVYMDEQGRNGHIWADGTVGGAIGDFSDVKTSYISLGVGGAAEDRIELYADDQGRLAVTRNGTLLGYLTITPPEE